MLNFSDNIDNNKIIYFLKKYITQKDCVTIFVNWDAGELIEKNGKKEATIFVDVLVKTTSNHKGLKLIDLKIKCLIDSFNFVCDANGFIDNRINILFKKDKELYNEILNKDWCRFLYNQLDDKDKVIYLKQLQECYKINGKMNENQIKDFVTEMKNNLPFNSLQFYRDNLEQFNELDKNYIEMLLHLKLRKNNIIDYFNEIDIDILDILNNDASKNNSMDNKRRYITNIALNEENIQLLQKRLAVLCQFYNDEVLDLFLDELYTSYINTQKLKAENDFNYLKQDVKFKKYYMQNCSSVAEKLLDEVINVNDIIDEEVVKKLEEFEIINKRLMENEKILEIYENLQYNFLEKTNSMIELEKFGKQAKDILKEENVENIR